MPKDLEIRIGLILILLALLGWGFFLYQDQTTVPHSNEVHVHADWLMVINDQPVDLTGDTYQSFSGDVKMADFHLHDNEDNVLHRHDDGLTLGMFLESIGFSLTNTCLTTDTNETFCEDTDHALALYVNGVRKKSPPNYVIEEEDQVLLYYGARDQALVDKYLGQITDESCVYSGTCPERGIAPPETCGLTCEI